MLIEPLHTFTEVKIFSTSLQIKCVYNVVYALFFFEKMIEMECVIESN